MNKKIIIKSNRKDISKLIAKQVVDKNGKTMTVYVSSGADDDEKRKKSKKITLIHKIQDFLGMDKPALLDHIIKLYKAGHVSHNFDNMSFRDFSLHFLEYMKNRKSWGRYADEGKVPVVATKNDVEDYNVTSSRKWNKDVMRYLDVAHRDFTKKQFHKYVNEIRQLLTDHGLNKKYAIESTAGNENYSLSINRRGEDGPKTVYKKDGKWYEAEKVIGYIHNYLIDKIDPKHADVEYGTIKKAGDGKVILFKAFGKKDKGRLRKKTIVDKRGKKTTVWVAPEGKEAQKKKKKKTPLGELSGKDKKKIKGKAKDFIDKKVKSKKKKKGKLSPEDKVKIRDSVKDFIKNVGETISQTYAGRPSEAQAGSTVEQAGKDVSQKTSEKNEKIKRAEKMEKEKKKKLAENRKKKKEEKNKSNSGDKKTEEFENLFKKKDTPKKE